MDNTLRQDSAGHDYIEIVPWLRLTVLDLPGGRELRLNTVGEGRVYPGPQFDAALAEDLISALRLLIMQP
jgi:hypothetical protein